MTTSDNIQKATDELSRAWATGAMLDKASNFPSDVLKAAANYEDVGSVADAWKTFGNVDTVDQRFKNTPDNFSDEDFEELAKRDPAFRKKLDDAKAEETTLDFIRSTPRYLSTPQNFGKMLQFLGKQHLNLPNFAELDNGISELQAAGFWTVPHLQAAFKELSRAGQLEVAQGEYRNLTLTEKLAVIADIRAGDLISALDKFIRCSFDGNVPNTSNGRMFSAQHPELVARAAWFVWAEVHAGEITNSQLQDFKKYMRGHSIITVKLLEDSYPHWLASIDARARSVEQPTAEQHEPELTEEQMNALSTEELDARIRQAARNQARQRWL